MIRRGGAAAGRARIGVCSRRGSARGARIRLQNLGRALARLAKDLLGAADRAAEMVGDVRHAMSLRVLHPENAPVARVEFAQHLARGDARDIRRLDAALGNGVARESSVAAPVAAAGIAHRADEPGAHVADAPLALEIADQHVMHDVLGLVFGHEPRGVTDEHLPVASIKLFEGHCLRSRARPARSAAWNSRGGIVVLHIH